MDDSRSEDVSHDKPVPATSLDRVSAASEADVEWEALMRLHGIGKPDDGLTRGTKPPIWLDLRRTPHSSAGGSILTPKLIAGIAVSLRYGSSRTYLEAGFGFHPRSFPKWLARGKCEQESIYGPFYSEVMAARRRLQKPAALAGVLDSVRSNGEKCEGLETAELEALRKRTGVIFAEDPVGLVELRWPKSGRKLTESQKVILRQSLTVRAWDSDGRIRLISFLADPPPRRRKSRAFVGGA